MSKAITPRRLWQNADISQSNMDKFRRQVNTNRSLALENYSDLHAWSTNPRTASDFWVELFEFENLKDGFRPSKAMDQSVSELLYIIIES